MRISQPIRYFMLAAICCGVVSVTQAQYVANYKKAADDYYAKGDFNSAATYYEKYIGLHPSVKGGYEPYIIQKQAAAVKKGAGSMEIRYRLAESYRNLTYYANAEKAYQQIVEEAPAQYPLARYWYAVCLRANGKYAEAKQQQQQFLSSYNGEEAYKKLAKQEIENCGFIEQSLAAADKHTTIQKYDSAVNKEGASYAAAWVDGNTLAYTSTRGTYTNQLYTAPVANNVIGAAAVLQFPGTNFDQQGVATFSADGKRIYFTAWEVAADGKKTSVLYSSEKRGNTWSKPALLNVTINAKGYSARQPQVTADGAYLLFASDMPGGNGKFDIWYAPLDAKGVAGKAVNAGSQVNTAEDEQAPFYHQASETLVFAANGRTGMGGFDLFASKGKIGGSWEAPVNLGAPVNSVKDDIYFTNQQAHGLLEHAIISSDRSSACCLELFAVNKLQPPPPPVVKETPVAAAPVTPKETPKEEIVVEHNRALLQHVLFAFNSAALDESSNGQLKAVAAYLQAHPDIKIEIGAHTDGTGKEAYNLKLSEQRAKACTDYLVKEGIAAERLVAKGYGACCPLEKETTADGKDIPEAREKNRRVALKVL
ncbi:OmpA family protein [Filimonas effusa]|uniref:Flagellar motor protein MotB n=1 Tax=Filimonas effusa TaxID=2508721 RepID=A0A4Q1DAT0_9BACT|nr:OmpA family protein [Filimonas effusa]RXK86534.1 flagellar motor protein MotB [Filimonas effusa]